MIERFIARLIAQYGVFPIAVAGFILLTIGLFAGIAGWNAIKSNWHESVAEAAKAQLQAQKANVKTLQQDLEKTDKAVEITADTVKKQDLTANRQRQETAKAKDIIHERIVKVPVVADPVIDPIVLDAVREARNKAVAAAGALSGTESAGSDTGSADLDGLSDMGNLCGEPAGFDRAGRGLPAGNSGMPGQLAA
jgi:formylmethanofuran:tetrahydromethanopterin formyltransferase